VTAGTAKNIFSTCAKDVAKLYTYDWSANSSTSVTLANVPRFLSLSGTKALVLGGFTGLCFGSTSTAELADLATNTTTTLAFADATVRYAAMFSNGAYTVLRQDNQIQLYQGSTLIQHHNAPIDLFADGSVQELGGPQYLLYLDKQGATYRLVLLDDPEWPALSGEGPAHITADQNGDHVIQAIELSRLIQLYNLHSYHCTTGTEDGYAPGPGDESCAPHQTDYSPQDWKISLSELLRLIQFYSAQGYHACTGTEDGYCPGL
jgi:hypothetical protein